MQNFTLAPNAMFTCLWKNRSLVKALVTREVTGRYKGSSIGIVWSIFNPLFMLVIYSFVFSVIFKARWGSNIGDSKASFALVLFIGLIIHGLLAECIERSPGLILSNANFVKKVIFPLEIFPWVVFFSALFHSAISLFVLMAAQIILRHQIPWTVIFFPIILLPISLITMGISWFLSALGVFVRDIEQVTGMINSILLFISGVFYPMSALPEKFQILAKINPLALTIELGRDAVIIGKIPNFWDWSILLIGGIMTAWIGFFWFQKTRKGFADVL